MADNSDSCGPTQILTISLETGLAEYYESYGPLPAITLASAETDFQEDYRDLTSRT